MSSSPLALQVYTLHRQRASGALMVLADGRESTLWFREGNVVAAQMSSRFVTPAQAGLCSGAISLEALDALWAKDALADLDVCADTLGVPSQSLENSHLLTLVTSLGKDDAKVVQFQESEDTPVDGVVPGPVALRVLFEQATAQTPFEDSGSCICSDVQASEYWALDEDDRTFLKSLEVPRSLESLTPRQRSLLELLKVDGKLQRVSEATTMAAPNEVAASFDELVIPMPAPIPEPAVEARPLVGDALKPQDEEGLWRIVATGEYKAPPSPLEEALSGFDRLEALTRVEAGLDSEDDSTSDSPTGDAGDAAVAETATVSPAEALRAYLAEAAANAPVRAVQTDAPAVEAFSRLSEAVAANLVNPPEEDGLTAFLEGAAANRPSRFLAPSDLASAFPDAPTDIGTEQAANVATDALTGVISADLSALFSAAANVSTSEDSATALASADIASAAATLSIADDLSASVDAGMADASQASGNVEVSDALTEEASLPQEEAEPLVIDAQGDEVGQVDLPPLELQLEDTEAQSVSFPRIEVGAASAQNHESLNPAQAGVGEEDDWAWDEEEDLASDSTDPAEAARLRRQRLLRRAMDNIGAFPVRPRVEGAQSVTAVEPPKAEAAPNPADAVPAEQDKALAEAIEKRHAMLTGPRNHFDILAIKTDATKDQVKSAFLSLAKVFHPDRLPPSLKHLSTKMNGVFESIREAYDVLYDDARRNAYLQTIAPKPAANAQKAPGASGKALSPSEDLYERGQVMLKKRDLVEAESLFEKAYATEPKSVYLAAKAWAIYLNPSRKSELPQVKTMLGDAIKADAKCDRAHYQLGVIARVEGDIEKAEKHFRAAVAANPKHLEANQELRLITRRKKT